MCLLPVHPGSVLGWVEASALLIVGLAIGIHNIFIRRTFSHFAVIMIVFV